MPQIPNNRWTVQRTTLKHCERKRYEGSQRNGGGVTWMISGKEMHKTSWNGNDMLRAVSTVPHSAGQSRIFIRCPAPTKWDRCPAFLENGIIFCFVADYFTCLPWNAIKWQTSNKAWFILRTPTDAVYISHAAAVTNDSLFFNAAGIINNAAYNMFIVADFCPRFS